MYWLASLNTLVSDSFEYPHIDIGDMDNNECQQVIDNLQDKKDKKEKLERKGKPLLNLSG